MKKLLFIFLAALLITGCEDNQKNIEKCYALFHEAEQSKQVIDTIPVGIKFGMTKDEIDSLLEKLSLDSVSTNVYKRGDFYYYTFKLSTGNYDAMIFLARPFSSKDEGINNISFIFRNSCIDLPESKDESLLKGLKEQFKDYSSSHCVIGDKEHLQNYYTIWTKDNLAVYLTSDNTGIYSCCALSFVNAPIDKPSGQLDFEQGITSSVNEKLKNEENKESDGQVTGADSYINTITGFTCEKAQVTDNGYLVIAIDANGSDYDALASQFLGEAKSEGVKGLKGVLIVDSKDCEFQKGAVIGDRIGKAYN